MYQITILFCPSPARISNYYIILPISSTYIKLLYYFAHLQHVYQITILFCPSPARICNYAYEFSIGISALEIKKEQAFKASKKAFLIRYIVATVGNVMVNIASHRLKNRAQKLTVLVLNPEYKFHFKIMNVCGPLIQRKTYIS